MCRARADVRQRPTRPNLLGELRRTLGKFYTWSDVCGESLAYGIRNPPHFAWDRKNGAKTLLQISREKNVTPVIAFTEEWYSAGCSRHENMPGDPRTRRSEEWRRLWRSPVIGIASVTQ